MAVVRIKEGATRTQNTVDGPAVQNAFKILKFPDSHLYSTDSVEETKHWISILEETKQRYKASRYKFKKEASTESGKLSFENSSKNRTNSKTSKPKLRQTEENQDWLKEMPEQLDVYIAQRDFEKAVDQVCVHNFKM